MFARLLAVGMVILIAAFAGFAQVKKTRVVFFGDSITELGVKENGYITEIGSLITRAGLADEYELVGAGISGNKIYDLYLRADDDVIRRSPDVVVMYVGISDIWHKRLLGTGTDFDKFGKFYEALVAKLQRSGSKLILCTPAVIGERTDFTNENDGELNLYSDWIKTFAAKRSLILVDLRKAFLDHNLRENRENKAAGILTTDKVHLNRKGNELVAAEIWKVLRQLRGE
jgi:lysophospholipase L1-like esterase